VDAIASLVGTPLRDPLTAIESPPPGTAVVELRLDHFPDLDPLAAVSRCPLPVLVTYRSDREGGRGSDDPGRRRQVLARAWEAGPALLDLEVERDLGLIGELGLDPDRVVLSWHDPEGTPSDLEARAARILEAGTRWAKVVPSARGVRDLAAVLQLHRRLNRGRPERRRLIAFAMGTTGIASRYLAPLLGPPVMFVSWDSESPAAPGQLDADAIDGVVGHLAGRPRKVFAVVGRDVSRSLSPRLHGAAYRALELPFAFLPLSVPDPDELELLFQPLGADVLAGAGLSLAGLAVTAPYKLHAAAAATVLAPRARRARAANTLLPRQGQILADTTDADGVVGSLLAAGIGPSGRTALIQGTGGAARGAAVGLDLAGATVVLRGRDARRTAAVAAEIRVDWCEPDATPDGAAILVNATPLGSNPADPCPFARDTVAAAAAVVDMAYGAGPTVLERLARGHGVTLIGGREVLLYQGFAQFAAMTGRRPPQDAMRRAVAGSA